MTEGREKECQRLPFKVDPFRSAHDELELDSSVPLAQMKRLAAMLYQTDGTVTASLRFTLDILGVATLQGRLQAGLDLICQRCMEPVHIDVDTSLALGFSRSKAGLEKIPTTLEAVQAEAGQVDLLQLLEDEIMLALPQIPRHADTECQPSAMADDIARIESLVEKQENPFSILAGLKTDKEH